MDWNEKRKLCMEKEASTLMKALEGKTIKSVETRLTWDGSEIESVHITFVDGSGVELNGGSDGGCAECDPDGCKISYLHTYVKEKK